MILNRRICNKDVSLSIQDDIINQYDFEYENYVNFCLSFITIFIDCLTTAITDVFVTLTTNNVNARNILITFSYGDAEKGTMCIVYSYIIDDKIKLKFPSDLDKEKFINSMKDVHSKIKIDFT